jgi:hypothetical protein
MVAETAASWVPVSSTPGAAVPVVASLAGAVGMDASFPSSPDVFAGPASSRAGVVSSDDPHPLA